MGSVEYTTLLQADWLHHINKDDVLLQVLLPRTKILPSLRPLGHKVRRPRAHFDDSDDQVDRVLDERTQYLTHQAGLPSKWLTQSELDNAGSLIDEYECREKRDCRGSKRSRPTSKSAKPSFDASEVQECPRPVAEAATLLIYASIRSQFYIKLIV